MTALALSAIAVLALVLGFLAGRSPSHPVASVRHVRLPHAPPALPARLRVRTPRDSSVVKIVDKTLRRIPLVVLGGRRHREIALTFDDGPGPYTLSLVRTLKQLHVPATFFQVGAMVPLFPLAEHAVAANPRFVIGDHTENHAQLPRLTSALQAGQIDDQASQLYSRRVPYPHLFRPPYGVYDSATLRLLHARHMLMVLWTIDSEDWRRPGTLAIVHRVLEYAKPGAIVLMHDAGGDRSQTVAALPAIVRGLRRRHFHLVTVPQMLQDAPPPLHQPRRPPSSPV